VDSICRNGRPKRSASVIERFNGFEMQGRPLTVNQAKHKNRAQAVVGQVVVEVVSVEDDRDRDRDRDRRW
jgi:hypothetical protein